MKKPAYFAVTLLLLPLGIAFAGEEHKASNAGKMTITGCLEQGQGGTYIIAAEAGKPVMVTGGSGKLAKHVKHTVKLTGKYDENAKASTDGTSTGHMHFKVNKVEHVSDDCTSPSAPGTKTNPSR